MVYKNQTKRTPGTYDVVVDDVAAVHTLLLVLISALVVVVV